MLLTAHRQTRQRQWKLMSTLHCQNSGQREILGVDIVVIQSKQRADSEMSMSLTLQSKKQTNRVSGCCCHWLYHENSWQTEEVDVGVVYLTPSKPLTELQSCFTSLTLVITIWNAQRPPFLSLISHGILTHSTMDHSSEYSWGRSPRSSRSKSRFGHVLTYSTFSIR